MAGLIGGSGSTGSSLLRQILNRHSHVFCGPETSLFCKPELYTDWEESKKSILKKGWGGLRSKSWHIFRGFELTKKEHNVSEDLLTPMIEQAQSFPEFAKAYFKNSLKDSKEIWLEKTPGNAYNFRSFISLFPNGKIIHIYRDPYDTIASLCNRGFSHYQATCIYLLNTSYALSCKDESAYEDISYESLVKDPEPTVQKLCKHLNIDFEQKMIFGESNTYTDDPTKIKGWNYDETSGIGVGSVGKFKTLPQKDQEIIIYACKTIQVSPIIVKKENLGYHNVNSLCKALGYEFKEQRTTSYYKDLKNQKSKDLWLRTKKNAYYNFFNYPVVMNNMI